MLACCTPCALAKGVCAAPGPQVIWYNSSDEFGPPPRTFAAPASGAYIFRPYSWVGSASPALVQVLEGPVLTEIRQARPLVSRNPTKKP